MSLREDLESSMTQLTGDNNEPQEQATEASSAPTPPAGPERDSSGRFAPREPARDAVSAHGQPQEAQVAGPAPAPQGQQANQSTSEAPAGPAQAPTAQQPTTQAPAPGFRPPVSWTPEERAEWDKLPPSAHAAISRREREMDQFMQNTAQARRFAGEVEQILQPYLPMIAAEQSTPARAIGELMKTAAFLRTAPPAQRAEAMADLVFQHGVDLNLFEQSLVNRITRQANPQYQQQTMVQQSIQQALAPVNQFIQQFTQQQEQAQNQQVQGSVEQFMSDPQYPYARQVAADMADLMDIYAQRGQQMTLQQAYQRATMAHPTIGPELIRQQQTQSAAQQTAAAQRALNAAVSPTGTGAPSQNEVPQGDGSLRSDLLASMTTLSARR